MKKLFFAAIALVAFSGVSMASTIEIENRKVESVSQNTFCSPPYPMEWAIQLAECSKAYADIVDAYTPVFGKDKAQTIALGALKGCMGLL